MLGQTPRGIFQLASAGLALVAAGCSEVAATPSGPPVAGEARAPAPSATAPAPEAAAPTASAERSSAAPGASGGRGGGPRSPPAGAAPRDARAPARPAPPRDSKSRFAWIRPSPGGSSAWIGYLGMGGSVALKGGSVEAARVAGAGRVDCTWYAVEPQGYVCAGKDATIDAADPAVVALRRAGPDVGSPWPYHYGESIGAPRYPRVPTEAEQRRAEIDLESHLDRVRRAREAGPEQVATVSKVLVGVDLEPAGKSAVDLFDAGYNVREGREWIASGSTLAWTSAFDAGGRTWLVAWDHAIVPKDRIRPYPRSGFHGVELGADAKLPLAFFRKSARPKYRRGDGGAMTRTEGEWPAQGWVGLTGEEIVDGGATYFATTEPGVFAAAADATVVRAAKRVPLLKRDAGPDRRKWLDISILGGWLVAYEGETPVFATLVSPGRGGLPAPGKDPLETASTPLGTFRVDGKFVTATMVSSTNDQLVHSEVQYVLNFHGPHALHGAYWHDAWGEPKSGGCVNLAPLDAQRIFQWTDPPMPAGWHGMKSVKELGPATTVVVHR